MQTIFNPDEALRFASWLEEECENMVIDLRDTSIVMLELSSRWNDIKYKSYLNGFDSSTDHLVRFTAEVREYVAYLRKKAAIVAQYLEE